MEQQTTMTKQKLMNYCLPAKYARGIVLTLAFAFLAQTIAKYPFFSIMGPLVIAILLGMGWKSLMGLPAHTEEGIAFSSKNLLRAGIILLGMRLNLADIVHAGWNVIILAVISIISAYFAVAALCRLFGVDPKLGMLTACGTAICGAAAVVAMQRQIRASNEQTAIAVVTVAILGTIFTLIYVLLYPILDIPPHAYGMFAGSSLHEIAHVLAAAAPAGSASVDLALLVKLTRVALLVPVAILLGIWVNRKEAGDKASLKSLPIPWFIVGFLATGLVHSFGILPESATGLLVQLAYLLIGMAMAGLGLGVDFLTLKKHGLQTFAAGFIGSILLSALDFALITYVF